jgi:phosphotransferase system  glucose/maltose/N-acetylglucosamine-specific IIC component
MDPHSTSFKVLLVASEIGVTFIVFFGFYIIFNRFNKKMKRHRKSHPEMQRSIQQEKDHVT